MRTAIAGTSRKASTWCGPYALALVSGLSYDEVYKKMLRAENRGLPKWRAKRKYLTGVSNHLMELVSKTVKSRFCFERHQRMTLANLPDHLAPNRIYIVNITDHYVVVDTRTWELCDNQSKAWHPISKSKHKRCFVQMVAEVKNHKL